MINHLDRLTTKQGLRYELLQMASYAWTDILKEAAASLEGDSTLDIEDGDVLGELIVSTAQVFEEWVLEGTTLAETTQSK